MSDHKQSITWEALMETTNRLAAELHAAQDEVDRLRDGITRHRETTLSSMSSPWNVGHEGKPITTPSRDDRDLWALIGDDDE